MHSERLLDHFQNPRNVGELDSPAVTVEVMNPACGDILRLSARAEAGVVAEVRYKVRGCTASIAAGSALTELLLGRPVGAIGAITADEVEAAIDGLITESKHAAVLCRDAARVLATKLK
jgi:nitrogen fixation protein NifU and related proteins